MYPAQAAQAENMCWCGNDYIGTLEWVLRLKYRDILVTHNYKFDTTKLIDNAAV